VDPKASLEDMENSWPYWDSNSKPSVIHPIASCYTDCAAAAWKQWFPHPKKFKTQKSSSRVLASVFCDKDKILLLDCLEKGARMMAKYYVALRDKLKQLLVSKCRGKLLKGLFVSSRQCCFSQGGHCVPEIGRSSLWSYETPGLLTWFALQTTSSFLVSKTPQGKKVF
jgi:hypothetical protein